METTNPLYLEDGKEVIYVDGSIVLLSEASEEQKDNATNIPDDPEGDGGFEIVASTILNPENEQKTTEEIVPLSDLDRYEAEIQAMRSSRYTSYSRTLADKLDDTATIDTDGEEIEDIDALRAWISDPEVIRLFGKITLDQAREYRDDELPNP